MTLPKLRQWSTLCVCAAMIFGLSLAHLLTPDATLSRAERRRLAQLPAFTPDAMMEGDYMDDFETYLLDQFPARDTFRTVKAVFSFDLLRQKDMGGLYTAKGHLGKLDFPLDEKQLSYGVRKLSNLTQRYLQNTAVYYAVIPDKNFYLTGDDYPHLDYEAMKDTLREGLVGMTEIELFDLLSADDYYRTDAHWRQEALEGVVARLTQTLGVPTPDWGAYERQELSPFYGVYYGQAALPASPDTLVYLESPATKGATVTSMEASGDKTVYTPDRFAGMDGYDVFLSGAQALLTVENVAAQTDRSLVIFRDSFGGSLAPLLLDSYRKVTLVDLRYLSSDLLEGLVDFDGADVLFLYSTSILNSAMLLK